jgi:GTP-binding protein
LMNSLFWRKGLVKTSSKPGKTRQANIFLVNKKHFFTDLPGYGFAKLWKDLKEKLDWLISWYLETKKNCIKKVVMLVDSKLWPQKSDEEMFEYILWLWLPLVIVLTKMDKLGNMDRKKSLNYTSKIFFGQEIIPTSTVKKLWITELEKSINKSLS